MSIDTSGKWWVGSDPKDVGEYLEKYSADGYQATEFRLAQCSCGGVSFNLWSDDDEGTAKRICVNCLTSHLVCDSEEYWTGASAKEWVCVECASKTCNVGVGFSMYDDGHVRWLYVGERCVSCGTLGCSAQWKVAYTPSSQLLDQI